MTTIISTRKSNVSKTLAFTLQQIVLIFFHSFKFQAIQNPNDEVLQEQAWAAVVPLVGKLKKFYEFSQRLGMPQLVLDLLLITLKLRVTHFLVEPVQEILLAKFITGKCFCAKNCL